MTLMVALPFGMLLQLASMMFVAVTIMPGISVIVTLTVPEQPDGELIKQV